MPPHETKETLKGCNQLPGLSKKDTTNGKASLSNLPQLSQEGYISSVTKVVLFPHFKPSKTNEKERQRDTESIRYVTGGATVVTLILEVSSGWAKSHDKVWKWLKATSTIFIFASGYWKTGTGIFFILTYKLLLDFHWWNKKIGFRDIASFRVPKNKMDTSLLCSVNIKSSVVLPLALLTVLFFGPYFWYAPVTRANTWAGPQRQQHMLGSGSTQMLKCILQ